MTRYAAPALLILIALACASAEKRYEQAQQAEAEGRWAKAAELYIAALKKDSEYPGARQGLKASGRKAIDGYLKMAGDFETASRFAHAIEEYEKADRLAAAASGVRVVIDLPADYRARRDAAFARALDEALRNADDLVAAGRYEEAAEAYVGASRRYDPSGKQRVRTLKGAYGAYLAAAKLELEAGDHERASGFVDRAVAVYGESAEETREARELRPVIDDARYQALLVETERLSGEGRYQDAYKMVREALDVYGEDDEASDAARVLREKVIEAGTIHVVATPVWRDDKLASVVPATLMGELDDELVEKYWTNPPMFIGMLDARTVRTELRGLGFDRQHLSDRQARAVGKVLDADFVVALSINSCQYDRKLTPVLREVATRDGKGATVRLYKKRVLNLSCAWRNVCVEDGRVQRSGEIKIEASRDLLHAVYDGDDSQLLLTREQHQWFDERRLAEADRALEREIAPNLAKHLAGNIYGNLEYNLR